MRSSKYFLIIIVLLSVFTLYAEKPFKYIETGVNPNSWATIPAGDFHYGQHQYLQNIDYDFEIMITDVTNEQYI